MFIVSDIFQDADHHVVLVETYETETAPEHLMHPPLSFGVTWALTDVTTMEVYPNIEVIYTYTQQEVACLTPTR